MDIQHFTHQGYRVSVWVAVVLSGLIVTLTALIGRGTLNLKGALVLPEPRDITVIALMEPKLEEDVTITSIELLRKQERTELKERPRYDYKVETSDGQHYLVILGFDAVKNEWTIVASDTLRADPASSNSAEASPEAPASGSGSLQ